MQATVEYLNVYKDEGFAIEAFKKFRLKKGVVCKKCGSTHHYWLKSKQQFQCKDCKFRTTIRSGTVLEGSKLPISYFFITLHLLLKKGNTLTVDELQVNTNHKYYEPLWDFLRKVKEYIRKNEQDPILITYLEVLNESSIPKAS
ncbi:MAG: transposase [Sporocytophaga sp.]|uniref:transposase n=1 Tax=Sporocytophaga TaxID=1011 RepID=UPI000415B78C|nr:MULTISPECIES: transposase [Sporocytophaga]MBO9702424.1 transposase [Sporocytophaga sp.]